MKRTFLTLLMFCLAGLAMAQSPFTIARPVDGAKVREKVHVMIPKNSVPQGGYIGIFLGDKFIEAIKPVPKGKYYEYVLDTKGRAIPDGHLKLEVVLYLDYEDGARILDRSSVDVIVTNHANIAVPAGGIKLRYNFVPGKVYNYSVSQRISHSNLSENQGSLGTKPAEMNVQVEKLRMQYQVQNAYGDGDGLLRIKALPAKGRTSAYITTPQDPTGQLYQDFEMASVYMRLSNTGLEEFSAVPPYVPIEGSSAQGGGSRNDLFAVFPPPTLPSKPIRLGSVWQSRFQNPNLDLSQIYTTNSLVSSLPARGELIGFEWENGHPCAKIRHSLSIGSDEPTPKTTNTRNPNGVVGGKMDVDEVFWFALDKKIVVKIVQTLNIDVKKTVQVGGGQGGFPGGRRRPGMPGFPDDDPNMNQDLDSGMNPDDAGDFNQQFPIQQVQQQTQIERLSMQRTFVLEK